MAILQCVTDSFRVQLLSAVHDFTADQIYIALYNESASLIPSTTVYTATGEVTDSGYTAGGKIVTGTGVSSIPGVAWITFNNVSWTVSGSSFGARAALLYNHTKANKSIAVLDFGKIQYANGTNFTVTFPPSPSINGPLRLA